MCVVILSMGRSGLDFCKRFCNQLTSQLLKKGESRRCSEIKYPKIARAIFKHK